jgi:hypothetical protein
VDLDGALPAVATALAPRDGSPADVAAALPREPGLVAWWLASNALSACSPGSLTSDDRIAASSTATPTLLAVGVATSLRNRVTRQDLWRTGVSWPRRCLAGLLLDELALSPVWAAEVVLPRADEDRLTGWMLAHLQLGWHADERRRELLAPLADALRPVLREDTEPARSAEERFVAAAGVRPRREPGVPYRRP